MTNKFAAFILTHGRAERQYTYKSLLKSGYTGSVYFIIDNTDKELQLYQKKYGDKVIVFDKNEIKKTFDTGDNFQDMRAIIYARNACFEIAEKLGIEYFIQLDDDYTSFVYKFNSEMNYKEMPIKNLDAIFSAMLEYYISIPALSIAFAQNGDFIGGKNSSFSKIIKPKRKCMNTFICSTKRKFTFVGRINEDVNTYVVDGSRGKLFLTIPMVAIIQKQTQSNAGGMTDLYIDSGTYIKSFYSVMYHPSSVTVCMMGDKHKRLHHKISWNNTVPCIVNEKILLNG